MAETDRLDDDTDWIDVAFVERERTPERIIKEGIRHHLAGLSLSNTVALLGSLGVERSQTAVHNWVQKADLQPAGGVCPDRVAVDQKTIRINDEEYWLYAVTGRRRRPVGSRAPLGDACRSRHEPNPPLTAVSDVYDPLRSGVSHRTRRETYRPRPRSRGSPLVRDSGVVGVPVRSPTERAGVISPRGAVRIRPSDWAPHPTDVDTITVSPAVGFIPRLPSWAFASNDCHFCRIATRWLGDSSLPVRAYTVSSARIGAETRLSNERRQFSDPS